MDKAHELLQEWMGRFETKAPNALISATVAYLAQPAPPRAPPREPTVEMSEAGMEMVLRYTNGSNHLLHGGLEAAWRAMYAAPAAEPVAQQPPPLGLMIRDEKPLGLVIRTAQQPEAPTQAKENLVHPLALKEVIRSVQRRVNQSDCPVEPPERTKEQG